MFNPPRFYVTDRDPGGRLVAAGTAQFVVQDMLHKLTTYELDELRSTLERVLATRREDEARAARHAALVHLREAKGLAPLSVAVLDDDCEYMDGMVGGLFRADPGHAAPAPHTTQGAG